MTLVFGCFWIGLTTMERVDRNVDVFDASTPCLKHKLSECFRFLTSYNYNRMGHRLLCAHFTGNSGDGHVPETHMLDFRFEKCKYVSIDTREAGIRPTTTTTNDLHMERAYFCSSDKIRANLSQTESFKQRQRLNRRGRAPPHCVFVFIE